MMRWLWVSFVVAVIAAALLGFCLFAQTSILAKSLATGSIAVSLAFFGLVAERSFDSPQFEAAGMASPGAILFSADGRVAAKRRARIDVWNARINDDAAISAG